MFAKKSEQVNDKGLYWEMIKMDEIRAFTLEKKNRKKFQPLSGIRTHDLCDAGAVLSQLSYQSYMRAVVYGLALYMGTFD